MRYMLYFLLISLLLSSCAAQRIPSAPVNMTEKPAIAAMEESIHQQINAVRRKNGLRPLTFSPRLREIARSQSSDMAEHRYLGHVDSKKRDLKARFAQFKVEDWREIGENVARSFGYDRNDEVMVKGWLKSPPHRANIMKKEYDSTGVGVVRGADGVYYATQVFMCKAN